MPRDAPPPSRKLRENQDLTPAHTRSSCGISSRRWPTCCVLGWPGPTFPSGSASRTRFQRRFRRWARRGLWDELFIDGIPTDALETVMLGSTVCKAQRFASEARGSSQEALGRSRGGPTAKVHALVDALGRPLSFLLTPGQAADCRHALSLIEGLDFRRLIGDRGYDTDELRDWLEEHEAEAVIPSKRNRKALIPHDQEAYKTRHRIENLFGKIKDLIRIAFEDKTQRSYAAFVSLACALINCQLCP